MEFDNFGLELEFEELLNLFLEYEYQEWEASNSVPTQESQETQELHETEEVLEVVDLSENEDISDFNL